MDLNHLVSACQSLLTTRNDFWLLSAITDRSYEEGAQNHGFRESVASFDAAGLSQALSEQLRSGINGNLAQIVGEIQGVQGPVVQNPSRVPDLQFWIDTYEIFVEVKLVYDCTFLKYYPSVAADAVKLRAHAAPNRRLVQIVFFTELPHFYYPSGKWYGQKWAKDRPGWIVRCGIASQYSELRRHLAHSPTWPADGPFRHKLQFPGEEVDEAFLNRWFQSVFSPDKEWAFRAAEHLNSASIGVAIWDWTDEWRGRSA